MPMPKRRKGESEDEFLDRCMGDDIMNKEYPDRDQRFAICKKQVNAAGGGACDLLMRADLHMAEGDGKKRPTFECLAYDGGPIRPDAPYLDAPLIIDLSSASSQDRIAAILNHDYREIVGQTTKVKIEADQIKMSGTITGDWMRPGEPAEHVMTHAKGGFVWPVSLGASIGGLDLLESNESETINGKEVHGPVYIARRVRLRHIAFLSDPADQSAKAKIAASGRASGNPNKELIMDFEAWLKALGFDDASALSETQHEKLEARWKEEIESSPKPKRGKRAANAGGGGNGEEDPPKLSKPPKSVDERLSAIRAERDRKKEINDLSARYATDYPDALEAVDEMRCSALEDDTMLVRDFENLLLRECTRYQRLDSTIKPSARRKDVIVQQEFEAALCKLGGMRSASLEKQFKPEILEAADRRWRFGLSVREFLELAARANGGFSGSYRSESLDVMMAAMPPANLRLAGGPSTYDVSGILGNVLNRFVVTYFESVDLSALKMISATRPVTDFRQIASYSLTGDLQYEKVEPGGEIKHGTFGETGYTNQADTYGKMVAIDRRDLINDDVGALSRIAQRLGRGGALALAHVFWTAYINNSAFFTTARGNLDEGADTALSLASVTLAKTLFNKQTDPDGKPIVVAPRILLVPPELESTAKTILQSTLIVMAGTADPPSTLGNANIHSGTLDLAMARELSNASYTGYSVLKWYVLAPPGILPVIETCYLNGREMPTIENAQADFDTLGIKMRGYFDFGVGMQEYRGGVAMKGEA